MEKQLEELRQQLEKQCQINQELKRQNKDLEQRLQEKDKLLSEYQDTEFPSQGSHEADPEVRKSRAAVMAPEPTPEDLEITRTRVKKTTSETSLIVKAIQKNDFLSRLDDEQTAMMVDLLVAFDFSPGKEVIKEGSEGDTMYIVAAGDLVVTQAGRELRSLRCGDVFGELAILYNCKRTATVRAKSVVRLWCMERLTYRTIMTNKSKKKREQLLGFLKTSRTLKDLNDIQLSKIIDSMEEVKYQDKDVIVREGAEANTFYIILKGEVLVSKNVSGHQKQIRRMGKGEHFGEQALIREVLRTATCTADGPVTCFSIDKEVFEETIPVEHLELFDDTKVLQQAEAPEKLSLGSLLQFKDLVPVQYQEGRYQGESVTTLKHGKYYAMKRVSKKHIVAKRQEDHMLFEKKILKAIQSDFIVSGGEVWTKLKEVGRFDESVAVFCAACVVDFGFAKEMVRGEKTYSFVGTPDPPFSSSEPQKIYAKILDGVIKYPPYLNEAAKSIISKLCRPRPGQRLGNTKNGIKDVRHHRWFSSMNWHKLRVGQVEAPTVRLVRKGPCYINFDRFPCDQVKAEEEFSGWDKDY
ncbi:hypothetical protein NHX12_025782 [Muraenolepis orangiensis]|uniref:Cyclic nucleotide-binding domain-containing protein n=1 Tax=Muraenolepis orangiensis TaxID=630683 RepID=A0A9Q0EDV0_9TELE|nr:hypothetical protein NHX12_025782 [Muraenolepis orangiensis]